jgi:hypothetical protein
MCLAMQVGLGLVPKILKENIYNRGAQPRWCQLPDAETCYIVMMYSAFFLAA